MHPNSVLSMAYGIMNLWYYVAAGKVPGTRVEMMVASYYSSLVQLLPTYVLQQH